MLEALLILAPLFATQSARPELPPTFAVSADEGDVVDAARRSPARRRPPVRRPPPPPQRVQGDVSPLNVGLAGAGGAAIGAGVGLAGITTAGLFASQILGPQPPEVILATAAIAIGIAVATPFMAGLGGGAGVLLSDPRSRPDEWQGLLQCAASGYCAGLAAVAGSLLGCNLGFNPGGDCLKLPGPDRPAEWTAGASIAGLVAGGLAGVVVGYLVAPDKTDPGIAIGVGTVTGALLGSAALGGVAGGLAASLR